MHKSNKNNNCSSFFWPTLICSCLLAEVVSSKPTKVCNVFLLYFDFIFVGRVIWKKIFVYVYMYYSFFLLLTVFWNKNQIMTEWICFPADSSAIQRRTSDAGFGTRRRPALALTDSQLILRRSPPGQDQQIPSGI